MKLQAELARLRRLYHHVVNKGNIRPEDIGITIEYLERLETIQQKNIKCDNCGGSKNVCPDYVCQGCKLVAIYGKQ